MRRMNPNDIAFRERIRTAMASETKRSRTADSIAEQRLGSGVFLQPAHGTDNPLTDPAVDLQRLLDDGLYFDALQPYRSDPLLKRHYARRRPKPKWCWGNCQTVVLGVRDHAPSGGVATSFLPPGFCKTTEFEAIMRAQLPWAEKERLRAMATDEMALVRLTEDCDFSAVCLFHESGVRQVVQTHEEWFVPYGA